VRIEISTSLQSRRRALYLNLERKHAVFGVFDLDAKAFA